MAKRRTALIATFTRAALAYWATVFPAICHERRRWRACAQSIPDPVLRRLALEAQTNKRANVEGAAAFAAFVPNRHRRTVIQAQVAFQSLYDYVDTLAEQPNPTPITNGRQLHRSLLDALDERPRQRDYYLHHPNHNDDGYLHAIVQACRVSVSSLPSQSSIMGTLHTVAQRIVTYQSLNLTESNGGHKDLERWARQATPADTSLHWWETAASAGSSLGIFALMAAGAQSHLPADEAARIADAYWPWIGALHSLLDSVVDLAQDRAADQHSLLDYYSTPKYAAHRFAILAQRSLYSMASLPNSYQHEVILAAMICSYLSTLEATSLPTTLTTLEEALTSVDDIISPAMLIFKIRRALTVHAGDHAT